MKTTITNIIEKKITTNCPRCAGRGYISQFQHHKGGECFQCKGEKSIFVKMEYTSYEREMSYGEMVATLKAAGFDYIKTDESNDIYTELFGATEKEMAAIKHFIELLPEAA